MNREKISIINIRGIYHIIDKGGRVKKFKPWLSDIFSLFYDKIMEKYIFPRLFNGDINKHFSILKEELGKIYNAKVIEIGTGSGILLKYLPNDNEYTGVDISIGLLKKAMSNLKKYGFKKFELYNTTAEILPFENNVFDIALCILSLNFIDNIELFLDELRRILKSNSLFFCAVPVPERKNKNVKIRGNLYSVDELKSIFNKYGFDFEIKSYVNGALIYFTAVLKKK